MRLLGRRKINMKKSQVAELVLDARSLWQMYYVEGVVANDYYHSGWSVGFFKMKAKMVELASLNRNIKNGCPLCEYFFDFYKQCKGCPLDWPISYTCMTPCGRKDSPYLLWERAETIEESLSASDAMIKLCEKWLDENNIEYEK
jgi:hypothetical protein